MCSMWPRCVTSVILFRQKAAGRQFACANRRPDGTATAFRLYPRWRISTITGLMSISCQYRKRPTTLNYVLSVSCSFVAPPALGATTPSHVAYGRASRIILKGVSAARRTLEKPPLWMTSRSFFSPA